jgi:hypothetical protein
MMAVTINKDGKLAKLTAAGDKVDGKVFLEAIIWVNPATANDDIEITNKRGETVRVITCGLAHSDEAREICEWVDTPTLKTLDSGTVHLILE